MPLSIALIVAMAFTAVGRGIGRSRSTRESVRGSSTSPGGRRELVHGESHSEETCHACGRWRESSNNDPDG